MPIRPLPQYHADTSYLAADGKATEHAELQLDLNREVVRVRRAGTDGFQIPLDEAREQLKAANSGLVNLSCHGHEFAVHALDMRRLMAPLEPVPSLKREDMTASAGVSDPASIPAQAPILRAAAAAATAVAFDFAHVRSQVFGPQRATRVPGAQFPAWERMMDRLIHHGTFPSPGERTAFIQAVGEKLFGRGTGALMGRMPGAKDIRENQAKLSRVFLKLVEARVRATAEVHNLRHALNHLGEQTMDEVLARGLADPLLDHRWFAAQSRVMLSGSTSAHFSHWDFALKDAELGGALSSIQNMLGQVADALKGKRVLLPRNPTSEGGSRPEAFWSEDLRHYGTSAHEFFSHDSGEILNAGKRVPRALERLEEALRTGDGDALLAALNDFAATSSTHLPDGDHRGFILAALGRSLEKEGLLGRPEGLLIRDALAHPDIAHGAVRLAKNFSHSLFDSPAAGVALREALEELPVLAATGRGRQLAEEVATLREVLPLRLSPLKPEDILRTQLPRIAALRGPFHGDEYETLREQLGAAVQVRDARRASGNDAGAQEISEALELWLRRTELESSRHGLSLGPAARGWLEGTAGPMPTSTEPEGAEAPALGARVLDALRLGDELYAVAALEAGSRRFADEEWERCAGSMKDLLQAQDGAWSPDAAVAVDNFLLHGRLQATQRQLRQIQELALRPGASSLSGAEVAQPFRDAGRLLQAVSLPQTREVLKGNLDGARQGLTTWDATRGLFPGEVQGAPHPYGQEPALLTDLAGRNAPPRPEELRLLGGEPFPAELPLSLDLTRAILFGNHRRIDDFLGELKGAAMAPEDAAALLQSLDARLEAAGATTPERLTVALSNNARGGSLARSARELQGLVIRLKAPPDPSLTTEQVESALNRALELAKTLGPGPSRDALAALVHLAEEALTGYEQLWRAQNHGAAQELPFGTGPHEAFEQMSLLAPEQLTWR